MLQERVFSIHGRVKHMQDAEEHQHTEKGSGLIPNPSSWWGDAPRINLRNEDAYREEECVERMRRLSRECVRQAHFSDEVNVAQEVEQEIADARRHERCKKQT